MKKATVKKMNLTRETLGTLGDKDMKEVLGGAARPTTNSVDVCCA